MNSSMTNARIARMDREELTDRLFPYVTPIQYGDAPMKVLRRLAIQARNELLRNKFRKN